MRYALPCELYCISVPPSCSVVTGKQPETRLCQTAKPTRSESTLWKAGKNGLNRVEWMDRLKVDRVEQSAANGQFMSTSASELKEKSFVSNTVHVDARSEADSKVEFSCLDYCFRFSDDTLMNR
jgi:hypothetical protein